jgi:hypothetical protein
MDLKELVKDNVVEFISYDAGTKHFTYKLTKGKHDSKIPDYLFLVPIEDIGTATMLRNDKAITFMRWIRKAIADQKLYEVK